MKKKSVRKKKILKHSSEGKADISEEGEKKSCFIDLNMGMWRTGKRRTRNKTWREKRGERIGQSAVICREVLQVHVESAKR